MLKRKTKKTWLGLSKKNTTFYFYFLKEVLSYLSLIVLRTDF